MCYFVPKNAHVCASHRRAVLHHGIIELVALGGAPGEEAALTHVIVEMLQAAIPEHIHTHTHKSVRTKVRLFADIRLFFR